MKNHPWTRLFSLVASILFVVGAALPAAGEEAPQVTVMTRNLYVGVDVSGAIAAIGSGDPATIIAGVSETWGKVRFTDFPARAEAIAREIDLARPDLVGLQEAELWRSAPFQSAAAAHHVEYDYVEILLKALKARGLNYAIVAEEQGFDIQMPGFLSELDAISGKLSWLRLTDREVILARTPPGRPSLRLSNSQTGHFETNVAYPVTADFTFVVQRGWASVDGTIGGHSFRFVTTHLEADDETVRDAQAAEVIAGPADTDLPVILVADANSNANGDTTSAAYGSFIGANFIDPWFEAHPGSFVTTCCNAELLTNSTFPVPADDEGRIDLILYRGASDFSPVAIGLLGTNPADRVSNGLALLWASDHAGVAATLQLLR